MTHQRRVAGNALLELSEEAVLAYLLESPNPDWTTLKAHADFREKWVLLFLKRSRAIPRSSILDIYQDMQLRKNYQVSLALLRCKFTPPPLSMNLVGNLRWMDLFNTLRLPVLPGAVRQKIEARLMEIMPRLALGEKITMARQAPRTLVRHLRLSAERPVIKALLQNYHFTYEDAMFLANYPRIRPEILEEVSLSARWRVYKEVRKSLLCNTKTPHSMIYPLAKTLTDFDLRQLLKDTKITTFTRRIVQRVLDEKLYAKKKTHTYKGAPRS